MILIIKGIRKIIVMMKRAAPINIAFFFDKFHFPLVINLFLLHFCNWFFSYKSYSKFECGKNILLRKNWPNLRRDDTGSQVQKGRNENIIKFAYNGLKVDIVLLLKKEFNKKDAIALLTTFLNELLIHYLKTTTSPF